MLGEVTGIFGFRGEVRLFLHNPGSDLLARPFPVRLELGDRVRDARLSARSGAGKRILGRFEEITDEAEARSWIGAHVTAAKADLPEAAPDEVYVHALIGAPVTVDGAVVGRLVDVSTPGPVALLEVDVGRKDPVFVPAIAEFVEALRPGGVALRPGALDE